MDSNTRMASPKSERFDWYKRCVNGGSSDFDYDLSSAENKNTKRKTDTDMRIFSSFLLTMNEMRLAETIDPVELDKYLTTFFSVIKKHDGNDYEPASLRGMLCSIERYLRARNYQKSLTRDMLFINTRNTLKDRQLVLREVAKTAKKDTQEVLTVTSVEKLKQLYTAKEFGPYNPMAVINSLCFAFVVHLKIRKAIDHKQLLWGDIVLKWHDSREYLCYEPVQGRDYIRPKLSNISHYRIYASEPGSPADPVSVYKLYASKRPGQTMAPDFPFYLGLAVNCQTTDQQPVWFKASPMGVNKLNDLVKIIREITGRTATSVPGVINSAGDNSVRCMITPTPDSTCNSNYIINGSGNGNIDDDISVTIDSMVIITGKEAISNSHTGKEEIGKETSYKTDFKGKETETNSMEQSDIDVREECKNTCIGTKTDKEDDTSQTKEYISSILSSLGDSDKREIVQWFKESYIDRDRESVCSKCQTPQRFSINFTWRPTDTDVVADIQATSLETPPQAESSTIVTNTRTPVSEPNEPITTTDTAQGGEDNRQRCKVDTNIDMFIRASDVKNRPVCVTNALIPPYKRSKSEEYDREQKLRRVGQIPHDVTPSHESDPCENEQKDQLSGFSGVEIPKHDSNDHTPVPTNETPVSGRVFPTNETPVIGNMFPGNANPWFAPWAFDPRLAMYLRHGLVSMYENCSPDLRNAHDSDA